MSTFPSILKFLFHEILFDLKHLLNSELKQENVYFQ